MKINMYKFLLVFIGNRLPISYYPFGKVANKFRVFCASRIAKSIGTNVNIEKGALLQETNVIGDNSGIGINCILSDYVTIGSNVMMGPECLIYTRNHKFNKINLTYEGFTEYSPVEIGDNVWIGARVTILPGVTVGKGSTIGANSVVTKNIPPYSVAVGNPAKIVKNLLD